MSCNFCRDSIEGLKEVEIPPKKDAPLTFSPTPQGAGGLILSPDFAGISNGKLYRCQWCTEYWHKKSKLKMIQTDPGDGTPGFGSDFFWVNEAVPMGYDLDKIKGDLL